MKYRFYILLCLTFMCALNFQSQGLMEEKNNFSRQDTLRGSITPERIWWDLTYYHLKVKVDPDKRYISGENTIKYRVLSANQTMQIDLQAPLKVTKVMQDGKELTVLHDGNAHFIRLTKQQVIGSTESIIVHYKGILKKLLERLGMVVFHGKKIPMATIL